jgi:hypothetical protein
MVGWRRLGGKALVLIRCGSGQLFRYQRLLANEDFTTRAHWCFSTNLRLGGVLLSAIGCRRVSRFALHLTFAASRRMRWRTEYISSTLP